MFVGTAVDHPAVVRQALVFVDLERRGAHRGQPRIGAEGFQRGDLGAARAADPPGLLEHAEALPTVAIPALGNVVVAPRGEAAGEEDRRGGVEDPRVLDGLAHLAGQVQGQQLGVATARHQQVGAGIDQFAARVAGLVLVTVVAQQETVDPELADAVGDDALQVGFQYQALRQLTLLQPAEPSVQFVEVVRHVLAEAATGLRQLGPHRSFGEHASAGAVCVGQAEDADAVEHDVADLLREQRVPAFRRHAAARQRMDDGLTGDERVLDETAEQIFVTVHAQAHGGLPADQGAGRDQVEGASLVQFGFVAAAELQLLDFRQPARQGQVALHFVFGGRGIDTMGHHQSLPRVCAHVPLLLDGNRAFRAPVWARGALRWAVPSESLPGIPGGRGFRGQEPDIRPDPSRGCVEWSLSRPMMQKWENACPPPS